MSVHLQEQLVTQLTWSGLSLSTVPGYWQINIVGSEVRKCLLGMCSGGDSRTFKLSNGSISKSVSNQVHSCKKLSYRVSL